MPKGEPGIPGAMGNQGTCDAQGFFLMLAGNIGSCLYTCSLSIYFLCIIKFSMTYQEFGRKYEPLLHIGSVFVSVATVLSCLLVGGINPIQNVCTMVAYPADCLTNDDVECIRGEKAFLYYNISYGIVGITFSVIFGIFVSVAWMVVRQERRNRRYTTFDVANSASEEGGGIKGCMARSLRRLLRKSDLPTRNDGPLAAALRRRTSRTGRASRRREKEAKTQAFLYIFGFFVPYIFVIVSAIRRQMGYEESFILGLLIAVFNPLQGLTNIFVYTFPHVAALRRSNSGYSWWKAFRITIISGGDHDDMESWRQMRRGSMTRSTNNSCFKRVCETIKYVLCQHDKHVISEGEVQGTDIVVGHNDTRLPNCDVEDPDCSVSMELDGKKETPNIDADTNEEEPCNIDAAAAVDEDDEKEMEDDARLVELMYR